MSTGSEFFKESKKVSEVLYDKALDVLESINPNIRSEFEKDIESQKVSNVAFDSVLASKLGEMGVAQFVNPNEKVQKQYLDKKRKIFGVENSTLQEDEESVPLIVKGLKKTIKKLISLERHFLGLS